MLLTILILCCVCLLSACATSHPDVPTGYSECDTIPALLPDYTDVVIPVNIAPLNFRIADESVEACVAEVTFADGKQTYGDGNKVLFDEQEWREMLQKSVGQKLNVQLYTCKDNQWSRHPAFAIEVVGDSIDPYVVYRSIPPSYSTYEHLTLNQRCIENFEDRVIYDNKTLDEPTQGHCVNCHAFQNYHTERMQFHVRAEFAGTVIYDQGKLEKVQTKSAETISAGVYPAWHPTLDLVAYSTNMTFQNFHTQYIGKVEVQDTQGDIVVFDVKQHKIIPVSMEPDKRAAFPTWSPDGKWLYYNAAPFVYEDSVAIAESNNPRVTLQNEANARYQEVHYNVLRRSFDASTMTFGPAEMVLDVAQEERSATVPRISPDGKYLLTSIGNYGCFHIWHPESDLYVTQLDSVIAHTDTVGMKFTYPLTKANSERSEGFHNWSSNGRWLLVASRRYDNNYSRLYFAYFDREGVAHKAFELPQQDPDFEANNLRSYNVPEFTVEPVRVSASDLAKVVQGQ